MGRNKPPGEAKIDGVVPPKMVWKRKGGYFKKVPQHIRKGVRWNGTYWYAWWCDQTGRKTSSALFQTYEEALEWRRAKEREAGWAVV